MFQHERYRMYLESAKMSAADFERQMRKQIVTQKIYELFLGSATPSRGELERNRRLANQKVNVRFVEVTKDDLAKLAKVTPQEAAEFTGAHGTEVETYYKDNKIEFTKAARYHARDLLIRIDEKRKEPAARKLIEEIAAQANSGNFAALVAKYSEDPGSKAKGGDLGDRDQGSLPASFETPVLALKAGEIGKPLKIEGGYHLVLLESKRDAGTAPLESVRTDIATKLMARARQDKVLLQVKDVVGGGDRKRVDGLVASLGKTWQTSGEFDLTSPTVPKLGEGKDVLKGVMETGGFGLVKRLVSAQNQNVIVDVTAWKETPDASVEVAGLDRMVAAKRAEGAFEAWIKTVEKGATIVRNSRLLE